MGERNVQLRRVASVVGLLIVAGGCASSAQQRAARSQLERAQTVYQQAEADPNVQMYAQGRLADAQKTLREAEQAKPSDERLHLSYLAEKKALFASVTGTTRSAWATFALARGPWLAQPTTDNAASAIAMAASAIQKKRPG
jgi:hypothetical protein